MIVACSTQCFAERNLGDALRMIRELHFAKADLAIQPGGAHLQPAEVLADVNKVAARLKAANIPFAAIHLESEAHNDAGLRDQFRAVCRLARLLTVPVVSIPAASIGTDDQLEVQRLKEWSKIADSEGVILALETRQGTMTEDVAGTVALCEKAPGIGLTLDPSHYLCGPKPTAELDPLYPYVRHVHLRDSKPDQFLMKVGQGEIEYGKIVNGLDRYRYDRALTVDMRPAPELDFSVEPEVRKLKFLLESLA